MEEDKGKKKYRYTYYTATGKEEIDVDEKWYEILRQADKETLEIETGISEKMDADWVLGCLSKRNKFFLFMFLFFMPFYKKMLRYFLVPQHLL